MIIINPFTADPVIRILLEEADICTLKILREMTSNWNELDLKELENRASEGKLCVNFSWAHSNNIMGLEEAREEFATFLEATRRIPQVFRGFRFNFPESFKIIQPSFFSQYSPMFIQLDISDQFRFNEESERLLKYILSSVSSILKDIILDSISGVKNLGELHKLTEIPEEKLIFPNQNKFTVKKIWNSVSEQFRIFFDSDAAPKLNELEAVRCDLFNLLQIDPMSSSYLCRWSRLTHLTLWNDWNNENNEITAQILLSLAQTGMKLKSFALNIIESFESITIPYLRSICVKLSQFLTLQAPSLESLYLIINFHCNAVLQDLLDDPECKIIFPVFPELVNLRFGQVSVEIEGSRIHLLNKMEPFPLQFPKLKCLIIYCYSTLKEIFWNISQEPVSLKLILFNDLYSKSTPLSEMSEFIGSIFKSVVKFFSDGNFVSNVNIPWEDTIEYLNLISVKAPLKLAHLKNLKFLEMTFDTFDESKFEIQLFLDYFKEALQLNLNLITFNSKIKISDEVKGQFISYFPFPVKFGPGYIQK